MVEPETVGNGKSRDAAIFAGAAEGEAAFDADTLLDRIVEASIAELGMAGSDLPVQAEPESEKSPALDETALFLEGAAAFLADRPDWSEILDRLRARLQERVKPAEPQSSTLQPTDQSG